MRRDQVEAPELQTEAVSLMRGLAALCSSQSQAYLQGINKWCTGSEDQLSALSFMGKNKEWFLLILIPVSLEAEKRLQGAV